MNDLSIASEVNSGVVVVTVSGRIDSETAPAFDAELIKIVTGNSKLVLNLKDVSYMSSAGVRAVVKAAQTAGKGGGVIKLASVPELVTSVLYTVGLNKVVHSYKTVDEAVATF
jgi:anti-sigma B factor antagonist